MKGCGTTLNKAVEQLERRMIQDALRRSEGNIARAARELGLSRKGLYLKIERLNFAAQSVVDDEIDLADENIESPLS